MTADHTNEAQAIRDRDLRIAVDCLRDGEKDQAAKVIRLSLAEQVGMLLGPDAMACVMAVTGRWCVLAEVASQR
jgi:hypothetical protein